MKIVKIRASAHLNLWPEMWRREWHFISMKMAETSSSGPKRARASGGNDMRKFKNLMIFKIYYLY
jgi:hypothetical protein